MLWAIAAYFNPSEYKSRLINYRTFRKHLRAPLVTVELSFTGRFQLQPADADILVQLSGGGILWQKERLLNVALRHLPPDCDLVAWLDCDVVFAQDDWPERARAALEQVSLVQLFSESCHLTSGAARDSLSWGPIYRVAFARGYKVATGRYGKEVAMRNAGVQVADYSTPGLAWAARRALLGRHGLYDARIAGAGDVAIVSAALGEFEHYLGDHAMNSRQVEHYRAWADDFSAEVGGRVGCVDGRIFHLWHGDLKDRKYRERQQGLLEFRFDPFTDIAVGANGCWRWNTNKPDLHEYLRGYFASRNEDATSAPGELSP